MFMLLVICLAMTVWLSPAPSTGVKRYWGPPFIPSLPRDAMPRGYPAWFP